MAIRSRDTLKTFFETGDYPTQSQFADLIDSLRHMQEPVAMSDVSGLIGVLNTMVTLAQVNDLLAPISGSLPGGGGSMMLAPNRLYRYLVVKSGSATNVTVSIGATVVHDDIPVNGAYVFTLLHYPMAEVALMIQSTQPVDYEIY